MEAAGAKLVGKEKEEGEESATFDITDVFASSSASVISFAEDLR
jgi:hypothetical protein